MKKSSDNNHSDYLPSDDVQRRAIMLGAAYDKSKEQAILAQIKPTLSVADDTDAGMSREDRDQIIYPAIFLTFITIMTGVGGGGVLFFLMTVAVLAGLIPATIAKRKGYDFGLWWIFGALLFIVAVPTALLIRPSETGLVKAGKFKQCPACAEIVKAEATLCRFCKTELPEVTDQPVIDTGLQSAARGDQEQPVRL